MKGVVFTSFIIAGLCKCGFAAVYTANAITDTFNENEIIIPENVIIGSNTNSIVINKQDMFIRNSGTINAVLNTNDNNLVIVNSGVIGGLDINGFSSVKQIISNNSEITDINVSGKKNRFSISVENFNNVNFSDIKDLDSDKFSFTKSSIIIDNFADWNNYEKSVSFIGNDNTLIITNSYTVESGTYIKNTAGATNIEVVISDQDNLHKAKITKEISGIFLEVVRETDYQKIFGSDKRGVLLSGLGNNNKLLSAMNKANNMTELNAVMNASYRFNNKILLKPLNIINKFNFINIYENDKTNKIGFSPIYIGGDKISGVGGNLYLSGNYENNYFSLNLYANKFTYQDSYEDFGGLTFGGDVKIQTYINDNYWARVISGFAFTKYNTGNIYHNGNIEKDPIGKSVYLLADIGKDFNIVENLTISPFGGVNLNNVSVLNNKDMNFDLRAGADIKYSFVMDDIKYKYSAMFGLDSSRDLFGKINIGFDAIQDKAGASLSFDIIDNSDFGLNYKFGINANIEF